MLTGEVQNKLSQNFSNDPPRAGPRLRPRVLRWSFMCNTFIYLCVHHDASIGSCFLGGGGVVVANNLALEAFERSHTQKVTLRSDLHTVLDTRVGPL
jgi:hypothetical protein